MIIVIIIITLIIHSNRVRQKFFQEISSFQSNNIANYATFKFKINANKFFRLTNFTLIFFLNCTFPTFDSHKKTQIESPVL